MQAPLPPHAPPSLAVLACLPVHPCPGGARPRRPPRAQAHSHQQPQPPALGSHDHAVTQPPPSANLVCRGGGQGGSGVGGVCGCVKRW